MIAKIKADPRRIDSLELMRLSTALSAPLDECHSATYCARSRRSSRIVPAS
jgi:hypothetical protein